MRIAVVGGSGLVGQLVAQAVSAAGHRPTVIARSTGVDIVTGSGLAAALQEASAVIDVSNVTTMSKAKSVAFFEAASRNLLAAERAAGVRHHVALSIVGVDRVALGYYAGKQRQEELVLRGEVPATVLRATQFHEFAGQMLARSKGPLVIVPRMRTQPIAAREVAGALVQLATSEPAGLAPELAGPEVLELKDLVRQVLSAGRSRRLVLPVRLPGAAGKAAASGGLLPAGPGPRGTQTFAEWLVESQTPEAAVGRRTPGSRTPE